MHTSKIIEPDQSEKLCRYTDAHNAAYNSWLTGADEFELRAAAEARAFIGTMKPRKMCSRALRDALKFSEMAS